MSLFASIEAKLETLWGDVTGEARAELEQLLADAKAEEAKLAPLLTQFETDLKATVTAVEPEVKSAVEALLAKLLADAGTVIPGLATGM